MAATATTIANSSPKKVSMFSAKGLFVLTKGLYTRMIQHNTIMQSIATRNEPATVVPFLRGLPVKYHQIDQVVVVRDERGLQQRFASLGFKPINNMIDVKKKECRNFLNRTKEIGVQQLFSLEFKIEIHLIPADRWAAANTAGRLVHAVPGLEDKVPTFIAMYQELLKMSREYENCKS